MRDFAVLRWRPDDEQANRVASAIVATLLRQKWTQTIDQPGWAALIARADAANAMAILDNGATFLVGKLHETRTIEDYVEGATVSAATDFLARCAGLVDSTWGAYVAIGQIPEAPERLDVFRDPIGMMECITWRVGNVRIVTSRPELLLDIAPPRGLAIDWNAVSTLLRFPNMVGEILPVDDVLSVPPGTLIRFDGASAERVTLWSPAAYCRASRVDVDAQRLPELIDHCIASWCRSQTVIAELSGGLDSAIVAAGLAKIDPTSIRGCFNYHATDAQGDERTYARAVANRLGLPLTEISCDHRIIDNALMIDMPVRLRPTVGSISLFHDRDLAARGQALGADLLVTGQGGDALFFQPATLLIAADIRRYVSGARHRYAAIRDLAAWTGTSLWRAGASALWPHRNFSELDLPDYSDFVSKDIRDKPAPLLWLADTEDLAPAKRLQLINLSTARAAFGGSWCSEAMQVAHPLMSQPLIEAILPIAAIDLTHARRDRALIRDAYEGHLPDILLDRQGKGSLTPFFGRLLAASVPFLCAYLLDGTLAAHHILNIPALEAALDSENLMQKDCYAELLTILMMEHWVRTWSTRIGNARFVA